MAHAITSAAAACVAPAAWAFARPSNSVPAWLLVVLVLCVANASDYLNGQSLDAPARPRPEACSSTTPPTVYFVTVSLAGRCPRRLDHDDPPRC